MIKIIIGIQIIGSILFVISMYFCFRSAIKRKEMDELKEFGDEVIEAWLDGYYDEVRSLLKPSDFIFAIHRSFSKVEEDTIVITPRFFWTLHKKVDGLSIATVYSNELGYKAYGDSVFIPVDEGEEDFVGALAKELEAAGMEYSSDLKDLISDCYEEPEMYFNLPPYEDKQEESSTADDIKEFIREHWEVEDCYNLIHDLINSLPPSEQEAWREKVVKTK